MSTDDPFGDLFGEEKQTQTSVATEEAGEAGEAGEQPEARPRGEGLPTLAGPWLVWDIETGPEDGDVLDRFFEWSDEKVLTKYELKALNSEFSAADVNLRPLVDPKKIEAKIKAAEKKHAEAKAAALGKAAAGREEAWRAHVDRAALSAVTGRVLCNGLLGEAGPALVCDLVYTDADEAAILRHFWQVFEAAKHRDCRIIGFNIFGFDLPFLVRRSWKHGVDVPRDVVRDGRYWHRLFVDLREAWLLGQRGGGPDNIGLDLVAAHLGCDRKVGSGAHFHRLYHSESAEERNAALVYAERDLEVTRQVAVKLGVI